MDEKDFKVRFISYIILNNNGLTQIPIKSICKLIHFSKVFIERNNGENIFNDVFYLV